MLATPNPDGLLFLAITPTVPSAFFAVTVNPTWFSKLSFVITFSVTFAAVIVTVVGSLWSANDFAVASILGFNPSNFELFVELKSVGAGTFVTSW